MTKNKKTNLILIVDDTPTNLALLGSLLEEEGYEIIVANSGTQALKSITRYLPDLILMDVNMPDLDGFETCKELKSSVKTADIPVIFLTALVETKDIVNCYNAGGVDYIAKPFNQSELLMRVRTQIELKDKTDRLKESNEKVNDLLRVLLHDLGNPIGGIKSILELGETDPEIYLKTKGLIINGINNCSNILESVRRMKAVEDGKMDFALMPLPLAKYINNSILQFDNKIVAKKLVVKVNILEEILVLVESVTFIHSVFNNILTNAMKFSLPNSTINIEATKNNGTVILSIKDQGIGMPENILQNIFSLTTQTSRPGTEGEPGTGYGMPLVKKFVESYGGTIEIKSFEEPSENHGTEVILYLKEGIQ